MNNCIKDYIKTLRLQAKNFNYIELLDGDKEFGKSL